MGTEGGDARELSSVEQDSLRRRVFKALRGGMTPAEASRTFNVSRTAIWKWRKRMEEGDLGVLHSKPRGRPKKTQLEDGNLLKVLKPVSDRCPDQLNLPYYLWTREAVQQLIADKCDLDLSIWTVGRYLNTWGMMPRKPLSTAYEKNPMATQAWLKKTYPVIQKQAKLEKAEIHWITSMGVDWYRQVSHVSEQKEKSSMRVADHMISTMTNRGHLTFMLFKGALTTGVLIRFLDKLKQQCRRKVFLIAETHPVYCAPAIDDWLQKNSEWVSIYRLPGRGQ